MLDCISPITQNGGEVRGFLDRAEYILSIAESALADVPLTDTDKPGFKRYIRRTPLGVILVIAPWKYVFSANQHQNTKFICYSFPYLVSINSVLPAIIAGLFVCCHCCLSLASRHAYRKFRPPQAQPTNTSNSRTFCTRIDSCWCPRGHYPGCSSVSFADVIRRAT